MKYINLRRLNIVGNRCEYEFDYPKEFEQYVADPKQKLFFELPESYDIKSVPQGILTIPFVGSILCVSMLMGIGIKVPDIDRTFYECIPDIKASFKKMFPYVDFCFEVLSDTVTDCRYPTREAPSLFFTGGVDATSALIEKIEEKPLLINIWGGDMLLTDTTGRTALEKYISTLTTQIGNEYIIMKSNCRRFFNERIIEDRLKTIIKPEHDHGWWASIAHILSMTSTIAPILYLRNIGLHYIGSSYSVNSDGFDANNLEMVNSIKIASCSFELLDANLERGDKIKKVVEYCQLNKLKVEFKVCWYAKASENCSHCEKCYRTIAETLCNHADPNDFGFRIDEKGYKQMHKFVKNNYVNPAFWEATRTIYLKEKDYWMSDKNISWLLDIDFNNERRINSSRRLSKLKNTLGRIKRAVWKK